MDQVKLKVERCLAVLFNHWDGLIGLLQGACIFY